MTYSKETLKTTTDCVQAAEALKASAKQVTDRDSHAAWWNEKVEFLNFVNGLLETGGFDGQGYDELMAAKSIIYYAEAAAGDAAVQHGTEI